MFKITYTGKVNGEREELNKRFATMKEAEDAKYFITHAKMYRGQFKRVKIEAC